MVHVDHEHRFDPMRRQVGSRLPKMVVACLGSQGHQNTALADRSGGTAAEGGEVPKKSPRGADSGLVFSGRGERALLGSAEGYWGGILQYQACRCTLRPRSADSRRRSGFFYIWTNADTDRNRFFVVKAPRSREMTPSSFRSRWAALSACSAARARCTSQQLPDRAGTGGNLPVTRSIGESKPSSEEDAGCTGGGGDWESSCPAITRSWSRKCTVCCRPAYRFTEPAWSPATPQVFGNRFSLWPIRSRRPSKGCEGKSTCFATRAWQQAS